jgi:thioredoxin-related protein
MSEILPDMKRLLLSAIVMATSTLFAGEGWQADYKAASEQAAKENKPILLEFTGSTWCPPCKMMKKDVFSNSDFLDFAQKNLILVEADFAPGGKPALPEYEKQNLALAGKYQIEGFPTVLLLSPAGKEIARSVGYLPGGPKAFIAWVEKSKK